MMKNLKEGSIDMVLADLPYKITNSPWDKPIDLGRLWEQYYRGSKIRLLAF